MQKLRDGRVLLVGGLLEGVANGLPDSDLYDPKTGEWTSVPPLRQGRYWVTAVALADGRLLVSGGQGPNGGAALNTAEIFDPLENAWTSAAPMSKPRIGHQLVLLPDGRALAAGGSDGTADGKPRNAEIYDPAADSWSDAGEMAEGRVYPFMTTLRDGKVLIAGGVGLASAELYDPAKNRWARTGSMSVDRFYYQGGTLPDGKILVTGGRGNDSAGATDTTEIYDPKSGRWTPAGNMTKKRGSHAMVMLGGTPLVIGGSNNTAAFDDTEFFDATAGAWRPGPRLSGQRTYPLAALLDDGRVLVASGRRGLGGAQVLATAEILGATGVLTSPREIAATPVPQPPPPQVFAPTRERRAWAPPPVLDPDNPDILPSAVTPRPHAHAIVIGVERYRERLPRADFAANDARLTAEYFRRVLGVPEENLALLSDDRATKSDFEKYFERWLPNRVEPGDEVYIYFSGHGAPNAKTGETYLVPFDADPTYIEQTGYSIKRVYQHLAKLPAKRVYLVMDSCFSGAGGRSVIAKGVRPLVTVVQNDVPGRIIVISASGGDQVSNSYQEKRHGLFTYYFLKGMKEKGSDIRAVYDYLKPQVSRVARREYNAEQDPEWKRGR